MGVQSRDTGSPGKERGTFDPAGVRFVLVEPTTGGNAGSAARALKNLGFSRLVLVRPGFDRGDRQARMMAVDATDLLERAEIHEDLDAALAGARTVVGTSARRGRYRRPHYRLDLFSEELARFAAAGELAVVFGREDRGLTDRELDRCTHLIHLPAADDYPSFNLAQALLLVAYELRRAVVGSLPCEPADPPAGHDERERMYRHLARALLAIGFLQDDTAESMMRRLRRLFGRAALTSDEVTILRGVARQMLWAAGRARADEETHGS
jgi:tRNA/rRNA methyltransferase/tRNA (cytidine32/uridine32-2'-O)-methyltransferase